MSDNVLPAQMMTLLTNLTEHVGRLDRQLQEQRQPQLPAGICLPPGARVFQFETEPGLPADLPPAPTAEPEEPAPAAQPVLPEAARLYGSTDFTLRSYKDSTRPHLTLLHYLGDHTVALYILYTLLIPVLPPPWSFDVYWPSASG